MKRKCVVVLAILVLMQVLCGVQSAPKTQTAGEKKPTILVESKNFFKNNPITILQIVFRFTIIISRFKRH